MPSTLLRSQFETLEEPSEDEHPVVVTVRGSIAKTATELLQLLATYITQLPNGSRHDPHVLLIEPTVPETDAAYCAPPACGTRPRGTDRFNRLLGARHVTAAGTAPEVREKTQRRRQPRWLVGGNLERVRR